MYSTAPYRMQTICNFQISCFLVLLPFFILSCSKDQEIETVGKTNFTGVLATNSKIYKGVFAAQNSEARGTINLILPQNGDTEAIYKGATAKVSLHSGEIFEVTAQEVLQKSSTADFKVFFESEDISFNFTLDENNFPVFSEVIYRDQMAAIVAAEHTEESPVIPITGTYRCTNCENQNSSYNGIPLNNEERTFNMLLTTTDGQSGLSIQAVVGMLVNTKVIASESCTTDDRFNICLIRSGESNSSEPLTWTGVHRYLKSTEAEGECSDISGKFEFASLEFGSIQGEFKSDTKCSGRTYYVSSTGNDNNTGISPLDPWRTISKINSLDLQPGDAVLFEGGKIFNGSIYLDSKDGNDSSNPIKISSYGTGRATIASGLADGLMAYNTSGIKVDNLIFSGTAQTSNKNSGIHFYTDLPGNIKLNYIEVTNCEVYGYRDSGVVIGSWNYTTGFNNVLIENNKVHDILDAGISSYGEFSQNKIGYAHSNVTVRNCEVYNITGYSKGNNSGNGIVLSDVQYSVIEYCTAYNSGSGNTFSGGGPVGIWYWDADNVTIQYNEVYGMKSGSKKDGGGFDLDGGVTNGIMQYNYSHDNEGAGYLIGQFSGARPLNNITVRYNISQNDAKTNGGSIYLFNGEGIDKMKNIYVYNNTLYLDGSSSYSGAANVKYIVWKPLNQNINFYNNILFAENGAAFIDIPAGYDGKFFGNLYHTTGSFRLNFKGNSYSSLSNFRTTGNEIYQGTPVGFEGDPFLTAPGTGGIIGFGNSLLSLEAYKIKEASPALGNGITIPFDTGLRDFYGNEIQNSTSNIGAHNLYIKIQ